MSWNHIKQSQLQGRAGSGVLRGFSRWDRFPPDGAAKWGTWWQRRPSCQTPGATPPSMSPVCIKIRVLTHVHVALECALSMHVGTMLPHVCGPVHLHSCVRAPLLQGSQPLWLWGLAEQWAPDPAPPLCRKHSACRDGRHGA